MSWSASPCVSAWYPSRLQAPVSSRNFWDALTIGEDFGERSGPIGTRCLPACGRVTLGTFKEYVFYGSQGGATG